MVGEKLYDAPVGLSPMRKFRLNRDRDEPASGPNFRIGGYSGGTTN
jgi:hypothetical protein